MTPTIYSTYEQSQQRPTLANSVRPTAFDRLFDQGPMPTQSVSDLSQAAASATRGGELAQNRQQSYQQYIGDVIDARVPAGEQDERMRFVSNPGTGSYRGSGYSDPNLGMIAGAIPAANEYGDIYKNPFDYGVDRLIWGGPTSGKSKPLDFVDRGAMQADKNRAEDALRRAIIPEGLRRDVANGLVQKWEREWMPEFNRLKTERTNQQNDWWGGSDWADKSMNPGYVNVRSPEYQRLVSPERTELIREAYRDPDTQVTIPGQAAQYLGGGTYYDPNSSSNYWKDLDNQLYPGMTRGFYLDPDGSGFSPNWSGPGTLAGSWIVDANLEEALYDRAIQQFQDYYRSRSPQQLYENPTFNVKYRSGVDYGSDWGFQLTPELQQAFNDYDLYNPSEIDYQFQLPTWDSTSGTQPGNAAVQYFPGTEARTETRPGQYHPAQYETIPALYETVPAVTDVVPPSLKAGFQTIVDPITGIPIPNFYAGGSPSSNADLMAAYGYPGWFMQ